MAKIEMLYAAFWYKRKSMFWYSVEQNKSTINDLPLDIVKTYLINSFISNYFYKWFDLYLYVKM